jgi:DME family drug/metabolite transporter
MVRHVARWMPPTPRPKGSILELPHATRDASATRRARRLGYAAALGAGALWGTTGPLSTALYAEGAELTSIGFWRVALATAGFAALALVRPSLLRVDRRAVVLVGGLGGALVALFEVAYQFGIAGAGVAGAAALLYTAPVMVVVLARALLGERLTPLRLLLAVGVMVGAALTVRGGSGVEALFGSREEGLAAGITGGLLAAVAYAGTTLIARWAVPRYGAVRVLALELAGGTALLAILLPLSGRPPVLPDGVAAWAYVAALSLGAVLGANFLFFAALRRIEAAPAAVAATIEPVVGATLALVLFGQGLTTAGWLGLGLVVASVSAGYLREASRPPSPPSGPRDREPRA